MPIDVLIVGPHVGLAEALRFALETRPDLVFAGWARDTAELEALLDEVSPDVVVVGADVASEIVPAVRRHRPGTAVLLLGDPGVTGDLLADDGTVLVLPDDSSFTDVLATIVGVVDDASPSDRGA